MLLFTIEQSTRTCSIALMRNGAPLGTRHWSDGLNHRQRLFLAIPDLLNEHKLDAAEIDQFVVGTGPGSFAGIRIAIAACQGMAQPSHAPVSGMASTALLAWSELQCNPGAHVVVVGDARRGAYWCAAYTWSENGMATVLKPQLIAPGALDNHLRDESVILSPEMDRIGEALRAQTGDRGRLIEGSCTPTASDLAHLASSELAFGRPIPPAAPIYLHPAVFVPPRFPTPDTPTHGEPSLARDAS